MNSILSDATISALINEPKVLPADFRSLIALRAAGRQERSDFEVVGSAGSRFRLMLRRAELNPLDFSVILGYHLPDTGSLMLLRRYNGKSHEHRNTLEKELPFYDFHIHKATERYQFAAGCKPEHYAEITDQYTDLTGALRCLLDDCGFVIPDNPQTSLFGDRI